MIEKFFGHCYFSLKKYGEVKRWRGCTPTWQKITWFWCLLIMYSSVILQKNVTLPRIKICESGAFHGTYKKLYFTNRESILGHADNVKLIFPVPIWFASFDEDFYSEPNNICTVRASVYSVKQNVGPLFGIRITFWFLEI